jgi:hypothetical protein
MRVGSWQPLFLTFSLTFAFALRLSALTIFGVASFIVVSGTALAGKQGVNKNGTATVGYFLEFRARGGVVGHAFMIAGRILDSGRSVRDHHFGFSPESNGMRGNLESLIGTPGSIGPQPLDFKMPTLAQLNVRLSSTQYRQLERALRRSRTRVPAFRLLSVNCNNFAGYIARSVGLRAPPDTLKHPADYVLGLAQLNRGAGAYYVGVNGQRQLGTSSGHERMRPASNMGRRTVRTRLRAMPRAPEQLNSVLSPTRWSSLAGELSASKSSSGWPMSA